MAGFKVITPPAIEPVTAEDVLSKNKYDDPDSQTIADVTDLIRAAREWCEAYQNRAYITQTLELALDAWPCAEIELSRPPLQSVVSITYATADEVTTWAADKYLVDDYAFVPRVVRQSGVSWPSACLIPVNGVRVRYIAGYGDSGDKVPEKVRQAITLLAMFWYENGQCEPPAAVYSLLRQDRVMPV